ncbi:N-methylhydantoinase A/oxoprolinase/acetone carboxylase, beta subunit [Desulfacinum hydrothermale DSM 13146]|uniref:N-methylhydantoinase A/oxoprolinase/acetone carboxylase, beta subunit n=1 Tax=Desulfacinum hydrothermale DSM 13146 TaxID=1121390 RepID=A0A1W1X2M3_9BACT|nr:hydantoinase/oxoprolinase family protein [Desulfacinum hydrothermale]SMC18155.1 N-methylhydantoinase A/oxoprolinase/acetone carboxylase, beta subunit [Desulfacinum hydrothermale DSM 13146]
MIIGLDVGGTHTDVVLLGPGGIERQAKVPTDHSNLIECVWSGLEKVTVGFPADRLERVVLSTTLTTNAIAENKLAPVGMIVSSGPGLDPETFRTNPHYHVVSGSIDHRGREIQPIDPMEIESVGARLRNQGIRQVGVVGKFSVRNPKHEIQIQQILEDHFDYVVMGHRLSGNLNFPRRIATAYLNAAVYPIHKRFFDAVRRSLEEHGLHIPIHILKADGGTMSFKASLDLPVQSILSGPAASVMGSLPFVSGEADTLVLDIGGTTTDMAVLVGDAPLLSPLGAQLGRYRTLIRALNTRSIGLGGDSAVRVANGILEIGPDREGPAMAYGGPCPTPTDALFVLGRDTQGDVDAARRGLQRIARELDTSLEDAARRVFDLACTRILDAAREMVDAINTKPVYTVRELLEGYRVQPKELLVLGGPAPFFASRMEELGPYTVRVVPQWHVANAVGAGLARTTCEVTLFVDTERGIASAPEEAFYQPVKRDFDKKKAVDLALELLGEKALAEGADPGDLEMEILEEHQFNMVRGFYTTGKNFRVKAQVKPGLIGTYRSIINQIHASRDVARQAGSPERG